MLGKLELQSDIKFGIKHGLIKRECDQSKISEIKSELIGKYYKPCKEFTGDLDSQYRTHKISGYQKIISGLGDVASLFSPFGDTAMITANSFMIFQPGVFFPPFGTLFGNWDAAGNYNMNNSFLPSSDWRYAMAAGTSIFATGDFLTSLSNATTLHSSIYYKKGIEKFRSEMLEKLKKEDPTYFGEKLKAFEEAERRAMPKRREQINRNLKWYRDEIEKLKGLSKELKRRCKMQGLGLTELEKKQIANNKAQCIKYLNCISYLEAYKCSDFLVEKSRIRILRKGINAFFYLPKLLGWAVILSMVGYVEGAFLAMLGQIPADLERARRNGYKLYVNLAERKIEQSMMDRIDNDSSWLGGKGGKFGKKLFITKLEHKKLVSYMGTFQKLSVEDIETIKDLLREKNKFLSKVEENALISLGHNVLDAGQIGLIRNLLENVGINSDEAHRRELYKRIIGIRNSKRPDIENNDDGARLCDILDEIWRNFSNKDFIKATSDNDIDRIYAKYCYEKVRKEAIADVKDEPFITKLFSRPFTARPWKVVDERKLYMLHRLKDNDKAFRNLVGTNYDAMFKVQHKELVAKTSVFSFADLENSTLQRRQREEQTVDYLLSEMLKLREYRLEIENTRGLLDSKDIEKLSLERVYTSVENERRLAGIIIQLNALCAGSCKLNPKEIIRDVIRIKSETQTEEERNRRLRILKDIILNELKFEAYETI